MVLYAVMPRAKKRVPAKDAPALRVLSSELSYKGPLFTVTTDLVQEPNGVTATRDLIRHSGSIVILPVDNSAKNAEPRVLLIQQYRYAANAVIWEIPAGRIEPGEDQLESDRRELKEETGFSAKRWKPIMHFYVSPGFLGEVMYVYMASGLIPGEAEPEEDEKISSRFFPLSRAVRMCQTGKIVDAKTISSIFWLFAQLKSNLAQR
jgi:ADP-ribose pyrophosphatase